MKTYEEKLAAYKQDKAHRLQKKVLKEQREKQEKIKEQDKIKREKEQLTLEIIEKKKELDALVKKEKKYTKRVNRMDEYFKLTMDMCDLMNWRLQLLNKIQEDPFNRFANNFQNIINHIDKELAEKRTRFKYLRTIYTK